MFSLSLSQALGGFDGFGTDTPGRIVDDPLQPQIVRAVVDDAEVAEHILHFCPVEETHTADDPVRNAVALQGKFQCVGLGIGPVQNGVIFKILALGSGNDLTGYEITLRALIHGFIDGNGLAVSVGSPKPLTLPADVMGDHRIGSIQDGLCGPVILFQTDHPGTPVLLFKAENILNRCAPEPVDTLVVVTHHADIFVSAGQQAGQQVLDMVGVLILVHQHILEFALIVAAHVLVFLQQPHCDTDDIIKIQRVILLQTGLILLIGPGNMQDPQVIGLLCPLQKLLRSGQIVLFLADGVQDYLGREGLVVQSHVLDDILHDPLGIRGIIDGKAFAVAHQLDIPPQDPAAGGMEGHGPDILCLGPQQDGKALL